MTIFSSLRSIVDKRVKPPKTLRVGPEIHPYTVHEFFTFRNALISRAIVEHAPNDIPRVMLKLWDGRLINVPFYRDAIHADTENRTCINFTYVLQGTITGEVLKKCSILLLFRNEHIVIDDPSEQRLRDDRFLQSEGEFWAAVSAAETGRVIEIGSRARSGIVRNNLFPTKLEYVGFDILEGPNVDVVGDAHALSTHFPPASFDFAFSVSVWEHLAMPWKVSIELNRILKLGGIAMIATHQSWPSHEEPWDYFRFSEYAWASLFNASTGFEIISSSHGVPCVMAPTIARPGLQDHKLEWHYGFLASRAVIRKIADTTLAWNVPTSEVAVGSYPF